MTYLQPYIAITRWLSGKIDVRLYYLRRVLMFGILLREITGAVADFLGMSK